MLKIILCDDDSFTLSMFSDLLGKAIDRLKLPAKLVCRASTAQELLHFITANPDTYLFFLDLDMGLASLNGLDIGQLIREKSPDSKIVYVTSHIERTLDILKSGVEPFGFIEKDYNQRLMLHEFSECLKKALKKQGAYSPCGHEEPSIELPIGIDETISIPISSITYVEALKTAAHNICYHTFDGSQITVRDTLRHALSLLGENFVQTHRSVIANRMYIIGTEHSQVKLSNGVSIACALVKLKEFRHFRQKQEVR